ncbi:hypothetical protein C8F04DRAFT_1198187 [Mycena alexandri]|uniref:Uncharacterized protein n=1 Tax=Mycena alexandri TaxID=1745969 RepID=A0AAD6WPK6_9AGAR|nr:hypothetical protein C8F04DRAFT_1198187 [Mycena alexandri]
MESLTQGKSLGEEILFLAASKAENKWHHIFTEDGLYANALLGDRMQWFRAEVEMYRWLEQYERKHVELMRVIKSWRDVVFKWMDELTFEFTSFIVSANEQRPVRCLTQNSSRRPDLSSWGTWVVSRYLSGGRELKWWMRT